MNKKTQDAVNGTDSKRVARAANCDILLLFKRTPSFLESIEGIPTGWSRYDYIVSSAEKSQNDSHQGYVILDSKGSIKDCSCGATNMDGEMTLCGDFQYRWNYDLNREDMASWDRYDGYQEDDPHTRDPALITNPSGKLSLCKHLYAVIEEIKNTKHSDLIRTEDGWLFPK